MPLYQFKCTKCNLSFDKLCKTSEPNPACPECWSTKTEKLLTVPKGFDFKGEGTYIKGAKTFDS